VVEFALVLPILLLLMVGILDLGRIYTTMLSVESAAREAADYGTFGSQLWADSAVPITEIEMRRRACTATINLPGYTGAADGSDCTNPAFGYQVSGDRGATWSAIGPELACDDAVREPPCWVRVTLSYNFPLLVPFHLEVFGQRYGLPDSLAFDQTSTFAMTDLELGP
jgi:hypothetical protein